MSRKVVWPVVAALAMMLVLIYWRGFFVRHAIIVGLGAAALVYSILRAAENLKNLHRR